jgi:ribonuclease R
MSKKRKGFRRTKTTIYGKGRKKDNNVEVVDSSTDLILSQLYVSQSPLSAKEIMRLPKLEDLGKQKVESALKSLQQEQFIQKNGRNKYLISSSAPLYSGTLEQHPRGFGFVTPDPGASSGQELARDIYISASRLGHSHHGDRVLVRLLRTRRNGRPEGAVIHVLSRGPDTVAGTFTVHDRDYLVYPDDPRFPFVIKVKEPREGHLRPGDCVVVKYTIPDQPTTILPGKIMEILGHPELVSTQARLVTEKFYLPRIFSRETVKEAESLKEDFSDIADREDLRNTDHITIDGETAKDFDDAVHVIESENGYRLFVSIADVSYFVAEGGPTDLDAYSRGTSIYFPGSVIPMLPERLSNDLCSLKPDEDRFTVSAILDFDKDGSVRGSRFCRSVIRSRHRFTYSTVSELLNDTSPELRRQFKPFLAQLESARRLALILREKREARGAVDFNLIEPEFTLAPDGKVSSVQQAARTEAHQIIEEFMLAANEAVAGLFQGRRIDALYRVHESPDQEKLEQFLDFAATLDLTLPPKSEQPKFLAGILESAKGSRYEFIVNNLLLRSLKQARYSEKNIGHFGLASPHYTHFTSPIRRYPDLVIHRLLVDLLFKSTDGRANSAHLRSALGEYLSTLERRAVSAERDMHTRLKILFMSKHIGEQFNGVVSGVTENGLFVEIPEFCVSGAISMEYLSDDYYLFDARNFRLFGEISAKTYQIGDPIRVELVDADLHGQKLFFSPFLK